MSHRTTFVRRARGLRIPAWLLLLGATASNLSAQDPTTRSTPQDSVRALEVARGEALIRADTVALSRMIAEEFIEISRLGQIRPRATNIGDIASGNLRLTSVKYDSVAVRLYGDVAVLTAIADNTGTFRGVPFSGKIRYMRIFVRRDNRWQAVAMQQTAMQ
jgi:uncharacterized protein DUF4440